MADYLNIAGRVRTTASDGVAMEAQEVKDLNQNKSQQEINADVQTELGDRYTKEETYSKEQLDDLITTPDVNHVSVVATDATTAVTDVLPATGEANTIYRVGNWNGTQYDPTMYALFAWNGTAYVCLAVRSFVGEVYDISVNHPDGQGNPTPYADLTAALGTSGANIPADIRRGGMSIKFIQGTVQSSDNKYVQYRLMAQSFTTDTTQWAIAEEGVYVENPEFVRVILDNENKILEAVRIDGTKLLPAGVEINEKIDFEGNETTIIESPEFVEVKLDSAGHILWGIQKDGNVFFGAGVPQQIIDYIEEKLADLSLDEYEDIVAFLNGLEKGDRTLQTLLDEKVDKEEGKSLINAEYASTKSTIDNPEYLEITTDSEDKVLEGIQTDGTKVIGGDLNVGGSANLNGNLRVLGNMEVSGVSYKVIENPEYLAAWVDAEDKVIFGLKVDGKTYVGDADFLDDVESIKAFLANFNNKNIDWDALTSITATENPEFMEVELDAEDKVLGGRKADGTKFENNDVELNGNAAVSGSLEVNGVVIKNSEDPENRSEITLDAEEKIISYRKDDGTLVENVGIESLKISTDSLNLSKSGMTEFQQALKDAGFQPGGAGDLSNVMSVEMPEPKKYGMMNLLLDSLPVISTDICAGYAVYYDYYGNSWKKPCEITIQGQSSRVYARTGGKGNYNLDITDGSEIKFGNWVSQDSFHLKGHAVDVTRAKLPTAYKLAYKIMEYLDAKPNRVLSKESQITATHATGDRFTDWDDDARCIPDGFPIEVYVNGEYWGLYSLQLKKHRKNYSMKKSDYESFFLDADAMMTNDLTHGIWNDGPDATSEVAGKTWWNGFEIKNPKDLVCMDGTAYDGDNPKELIDSTSQYYDSSNKKHVGSAKTKAIIRNFSTKYNEVMSLITSVSYIVGSSSDSSFISNKTKKVFSILYLKEPADGTLNGVTKTFPVNTELFQSGENIYAIGDAEDYEAAKLKFAEYFDVNSCIAVTIFNCFMRNTDSIKKNTLWGTYKNGKIAAFFWDLDAVYGQGTFNIGIPAADAWYIYKSAEWPIKLLSILFDSEIKTAYSNLRRDGIINVKSWREVFFGWVNRVGADAYKRDIEKWNETVTYRKNFTNVDYWEERPNDSAANVPLWSNLENYDVGAKVKLLVYPGENSYLVYQATQSSSSQNPQCPVTEFYEGYPQVGGYYDSPKRMEKWVEAQITVSDNYLNYNV